MDVSERNFETTIEESLLAGRPGGYRKREPEDYDRALCLDPGPLLDFIYATQPKEWEKLTKYYGGEVKERFLKRLSSEVVKRGTLDVLRKGVKDSGCKFQIACFRPVSGLNEELQRLYQANQFTVIRQLKYSERTDHSLDLALFLNGLPIFTAELKDPFTGQNVQDAIRQYRFDRDPREPLFAFGRCLAHFAVDPDLVYVTTHLEGPLTEFLPFNRGRSGGAGNPPVFDGFATSYLWEQIWSRDSILNLIQHFIQVIVDEDEQGRKTRERRLIFPRYHQLGAVQRLVADARAVGPGHRYLVQHSAGSGKSNSIAWLAHQLSVLHDAEDRRVFDSIIVITDRRVLDRQLQGTVRQFQQTRGVVENIDKTSRQLKEALESGKTIIVTTLQKFPVIANEIDALPGKRFAVVIDEAHSSQTGESTKGLKTVLAVGSLEEAEKQETGDLEDLEDQIVAEMKKRGQLPNVSTFAFTATPKPKTLELFGTQRSDGKYEAFSLYTMRQAIEEGFILDVLENYTTYREYWSLLKKIEDDPRYDRRKAAYLLRLFVDLQEHTISQKIAIMVEHFASQVAHRIDGEAKAMIVTRSRLHAVRYKLALDQHLKEKGYPYKSLVAFTGTVHDGGIDYGESNMNGFPESHTAERFKRKEYRFLIVAEKFQTGFDQPFLHTMYVDKKLGGVHAVQTLSRLNRVHPAKDETMVLDFANEAEDIQEAFQPYYDRTLLSEGTDPNLLYDLQTRLADFDFFSEAEVDAFASIYFDPSATQDKLHAALVSAVDRYRDAEEQERADFRGQLTEYVRLYSFLSQILAFVDTDLEKLYVFGRLLLRKLPVSRDQLPVEIQQAIDIDSFRISKTHTGKISLARGAPELEPVTAKGAYVPTPEELEPLSQIIRELNQRFGTDFKEDDKVFIEQLEGKLARDVALEASVRVNTPENARLTFDQVVNDRLQDLIETNFKFYKQITDDREFAKAFLDWLFGRYLKTSGASAR
jgi:type I restriction enzyme R subunit